MKRPGTTVPPAARLRVRRLERWRRQLAGLAIITSGASLLACRGNEPAPESAPSAAPREAPLAAGGKNEPAPELEPRVERDVLTQRLAGCEVEHYGRLVDLGGEEASPWSGFRLQTPHADDLVLRDGATYLESGSRALDFQLWLEEPLERLRITLRGRAAAARRVQVSFDGRRVGVARLPEKEPRAFDLPELNATIPRGLHEVSLRFTGAARGAQGAQAELDWLRIASAEHHRNDESYAPPTLSDIQENVVIDGTPRRSIVLRAPSTVRCFLRPGARSELRLQLGLWGAAQGTAEILARREGAEPVLLESRRVSGGDAQKWLPVSVDLSRFAGEPVSLELRATEATRGGRIAFGEAEVVRIAHGEGRASDTRVAVVVVFSSLEAARVPPWGPTGGLVALSTLSQAGAAFSRYRAPTTVPAGVLTTLLTGLLPRAHAVEAPMLSIPAELRTLPRLLKEANGSAAMFTSVPTTFAPFGFGAGWDRFEAFSPVKDLSAGEPFTRAAAWLRRELEERPQSRHLVLIHARGFHPPWDLSREEAQKLKPLEYNGAIEPRRAAIVLGALRARGNRTGKRLVEDDWTRIRALGDAALVKQDAALGQLFAVLKRANAWDSSLIVALGDVGPGLPPDLPYDPAGALGEERLTVPLWVKFPGGAFAGKEIQTPVTALDVAATLARTLDLKAGRSDEPTLLARAGGAAALHDAQHATLYGRFSTRVGPWVLRGELGQRPRLCALDIDPACSVDVFAERSIAARVAWLATLQGEAVAVPRELGKAERTPAELDAETRAALVVWGDVP